MSKFLPQLPLLTTEEVAKLRHHMREMERHQAIIRAILEPKRRRRSKITIEDTVELAKLGSRSPA